MIDIFNQVARDLPEGWRIYCRDDRCFKRLGSEGGWEMKRKRCQHDQPCHDPRCKSGLPNKFTDRECAAWVWLHDRDIRLWVVDLIDKTVVDGRGKFRNLIDKAYHHGWEG